MIPYIQEYLPSKETENAADGWMDNLRFYVLLTVFQSYQDDGRLITKGRNGSPFTIEKISPRAGI